MDPLTPDERAQISRRIVCPLPWCTGAWLDHGGDGDPPEAWIHDEDAGRDLGHGAALARSQVGGGPVEYALAIGGASIAANEDPTQLAHMLREIAAAIEASDGA